MRRRASLVLGITMLVLGMFGSGSGASAGTPGKLHSPAFRYLQQHGYLPIHGVSALAHAKAYAAAWAARQHRGRAPAASSAGTNPVIGFSWNGLTDTVGTPYDATGAIGPNTYIEVINTRVGLYRPDGFLLTAAEFSQLTGDNGFLSDPTILWDPDTQRFYYEIWNVFSGNIDWGFSKDDAPTSIPGSFCNYSTNFGYPSGSFIDYPKLGQTTGFLLIGVNFYPTGSNLHATHSDVLWLSKPQGQNPITQCPAANTFKHGTFQDLRNEDGTQAFTPVPAIQTDPSSTGFVVTASDIECPDICGNGNLITVHAVRPKPTDPTVPQLLKTGHSVTVTTFAPPAAAPQKSTTNKLDSLDGRLTHAVEGFDPNFGANTIWLSHTVLGGAGSEVRWYEVKPTPISSPTLVQSGKATNASLYVLNGGISPDRTVNLSGSAHGGSMVMGFTTSSSTQFPAIQMVSKVGSNAQSGFVLVKQSPSFENDSSCNPVCRWGDYSGATPDPAASLVAASGRVALTNEWANGGAIMKSWNWEALP